MSCGWSAIGGVDGDATVDALVQEKVGALRLGSVDRGWSLYNVLIVRIKALNLAQLIELTAGSHGLALTAGFPLIVKTNILGLNLLNLAIDDDHFGDAAPLTSLALSRAFSYTKVRSDFGGSR